MGTDWRDQISSIIADTNRNLGGRGLPLTHVPPLSFRSTRPVGLDTAFGEAMARTSASAGAMGVGSSFGFGSPSQADLSAGAASSASVAAPAAAGGDKPATALDNLLTAGLQSQAGNFQSSLQRILESVKFELDVRGSMSQKHMEAVREEMSSGMQEAERRCLDISRQVDTAVGVRLDTERQLREATERTVQRLQEGIAEQHKESLRVVGDFQATALDHSEAPRRAQSGRLGGATAGHHGPTRRRPKALGCPSWLVRRHAAARQMPPRGRFTSEPDHRPRTHRPRRARLTVCLTVVRLSARRCCAGSSRSCSRSSSRPRRS